MSAKRKNEHIDLALRSQMPQNEVDDRFSYEPLLSAHTDDTPQFITFLNKQMRVPIWVSSMTGGTEYAGIINRNLARACNEFGMGMGLGSCRILIDDPSTLYQFDMRPIIGYDAPLYANLGIAQIEKYLLLNELDKIHVMVEKLSADGLIIHVNPLQEWLQPEGDRIKIPAIETIKSFLHLAPYPVIIKEVGQGMGYQSLKELLMLPIEAIEFAAFGGTNFARLELMRSEPARMELFSPLSNIGNTADGMMEDLLKIVNEGIEIKTKSIIISGGIRNFLDGYYFISKCPLPAVYGQASAFLRYAREDYDLLRSFVSNQIEGLKIAKAFLRVKAI